MGKWSTVNDADAAGDRKPYFETGKYKCRIMRCISREGRQGDVFFIIEAEVLESDNEAIVVGRQYSNVIKFNQDMGPINVKRFIIAANGMDPNDPDNNDEVDEDVVEAALSAEQPLAGTIMDLQCDNIQTKANKDFTKHTWFQAENVGGEEAGEGEEGEEGEEEAAG